MNEVRSVSQSVSTSSEFLFISSTFNSWSQLPETFDFKPSSVRTKYLKMVFLWWISSIFIAFQNHWPLFLWVWWWKICLKWRLQNRKVATVWKYHSKFHVCFSTIAVFLSLLQKGIFSFSIIKSKLCVLPRKTELS